MNRIALTAVAVLALVMPAAAQVAGGPSPGSGVTRAQFAVLLDQEFADTDGDKDGKVSTAEIGAFRQRRLVEQRRQANAVRFDQLDKDKNGWLDRQEFAAVVPQAPTVNGAPLVARFDTNKDGALSLEEYRTGSMADFERLDVDRNGTLAPAEARARQAQPATP